MKRSGTPNGCPALFVFQGLSQRPNSNRARFSLACARTFSAERTEAASRFRLHSVTRARSTGDQSLGFGTYFPVSGRYTSGPGPRKFGDGSVSDHSADHVQPSLVTPLAAWRSARSHAVCPPQRRPCVSDVHDMASTLTLPGDACVRGLLGVTCWRAGALSARRRVRTVPVVPGGCPLR